MPMPPQDLPVLQHAGLSMPGAGELIVILLIVIVVFGHNRLPGIGAGFGQAIRNFKKSMSGEDEVETKPTANAKGKEMEEHAAAPAPEKAQDANKVL